MGVTERPEWAERKIEELYELLDDEDYTQAQNAFKQLEEELGIDDPSLTAARSLFNSRSRQN